MAHSNLSGIYDSFGQYEKALDEAREALGLDVTSGYYDNVVGRYRALNRLEEARATVKEAQAKNLDSPNLHINLYIFSSWRMTRPG